MLKEFVIVWQRPDSYENATRRHFAGYVIGISLHGLTALTTPSAKDARRFLTWKQAADYIRERSCRFGATAPAYIVPFHDGRKVNGR